MGVELQTIDITDKEFNLLRDLVYERSGIKLNDTKKNLVQGRLHKLLKTGEFTSFRQYYNYLVKRDSSGDELLNMLDAITTNFTSFFREERHFDFLNTSYLPNLIEQKSKKGVFGLRLWSAGCSSGEEPYSLAITVLENIDDPTRWNFQILASDISTKMLITAQRGLYEKKQLRDFPFETLHRYFDKFIENKKKFYQAKPRLKGCVKFRQFNLMEPF